jgi:hypothetical protein
MQQVHENLTVPDQVLSFRYQLFLDVSVSVSKWWQTRKRVKRTMSSKSDENTEGQFGQWSETRGFATMQGSGN